MSWISLRGESGTPLMWAGQTSSQRPQFTQASRSSRLFQLYCSIFWVPLDAERLDRVGVGLRELLDVRVAELSGGVQVAEEDVREAEEDVTELPVHQVADEAEGGHRVEPPREAVKPEERLRADASHGKRDEVSPRRPARQLGLLLELGDGDSDAFDEEALEEDEQQQREREPVVHHRVETRRPLHAAPPYDHAQADDAQHAEGIAEEGVPEIEAALQVVDAGPLLQRDERGRHQLREESIEDEEVRDAGVGVAKLPAVAEDLDQQPREPLGKPIEARLPAAQAPQAQALVDAVDQESRGHRGEEVDQRCTGDVPVDLARERHAVAFFESCPIRLPRSSERPPPAAGRPLKTPRKLPAAKRPSQLRRRASPAANCARRAPVAPRKPRRAVVGDI
jgi:hypothetical protein